MAQLEYCPFCGGQPNWDYRQDLEITFILCEDCGATISFRGRKGISDTIKAFNFRVDKKDPNKGL